MFITNLVSVCDLNTCIDLTHLARTNINIIYRPQQFSGASWRHRKINGVLVVFRTGKVVHLGKPGDKPPRIHIRRFARLLQKQGYDIFLSPIICVSKSAVHRLSGCVNLAELPGHFECEVINAAIIKRGNVSYSIFHTGTVIITGVKQLSAVYPVLLELELYTK